VKCGFWLRVELIKCSLERGGYRYPLVEASVVVDTLGSVKAGCQPRLRETGVGDLDEGSNVDGGGRGLSILGRCGIIAEAGCWLRSGTG